MNTHVLFVCTGNLCRSPLAQGLLERALVARGLSELVTVDSAGTHARAGMRPEPFAVEVAAARGADIAEQRSRALATEDFYKFQHIIALDLGHLDQLRFMQPPDSGAVTRLLLAGMAARGDAEVPDPYGEDLSAFEYCARLIDAGINRLVDELAEELARS